VSPGGNLLRALAHELRNSIAPVVNAVHLIRLRGSADPELPAILSIIERQVAAMTRSLDTIVDADRLLRGETSLQTRRIDVASAVQTALQSKRPLIESRGQRLHFAPLQRPVWIDADQARLAQALANVLDNAARYTDEGGEISIEVDAGTNEVEIRISDSGRGIAADVLPEVFEAFALRHPARGGLGVGLTVARKLCELHGGRIAVRSEGEGRGSTFVISIPLALEAGDRMQSPAATSSPAANSAKVAHGPGGRRILVADDNQAVRSSFAAILQELGHDVKLAADGVQALELAEQWEPEFVILDVHMPNINGYAVARKLRTRFPPGVMRLVMMSGTDLDQATLLGAKEAGFDHCIDKTLAVKGLDALLRGEEPPSPVQGG
jgi:CheY-like chemotaxis protein